MGSKRAKTSLSFFNWRQAWLTINQINRQRRRNALKLKRTASRVWHAGNAVTSLWSAPVCVNMTISPGKLRNQARRLDRLNGKVATVLTVMRRGEALILEYRWHGRVWCLSGGRHITDEIAQVVIQNTNVTSVGDALFQGVRSQTHRWIES